MSAAEYMPLLGCMICCCLIITAIILTMAGSSRSSTVATCYAQQALMLPGNGTGIEGGETSISCSGEQILTLGGNVAVAFRINQTTLQYGVVQAFHNAVALAQSCDGSFVAIAGRNNVISMYVATPTIFALYNQPLPCPATLLAMSCTNLVLVAAKTTLATVFQYNGTHFAEKTKIHTKHPIGAIAVSCRGDAIALTQPQARYVGLYDSQTGTLIASAEEPSVSTFATSVALSGPRGQLMAVGAPNASRIFLYNCRETCEPHDVLHEPGQPGFGWSVSLNGNGGRLLAGTWSTYAFPGNVTLYTWNDRLGRYKAEPTPSDAEMGKYVALGHAGREYVVSTGGTASRRIAQAGCWKRVGTACPACV